MIGIAKITLDINLRNQVRRNPIRDRLTEIVTGIQITQIQAIAQTTQIGRITPTTNTITRQPLPIEIRITRRINLQIRTNLQTLKPTKPKRSNITLEVPSLPSAHTLGSNLQRPIIHLCRKKRLPGDRSSPT